MTARYTVCVLSFGDERRLLHRCLRSLARHLPDPRVAELRVALNDPSPALERLAEIHCRHAGVPWRLHARPGRRAKYPAMRDLLEESVQVPPAMRGPCLSNYIVWFDDDSFVRPATADFFGRLDAAVADGADLVGSRYRIRLRPGQPAWIAAQPWGGPGYVAGQVVSFMQGAFWAARTSKLLAAGYPWPDLHHNGGDVMLGLLAARQGWATRNDSCGVAINADGAGRESKGPRRGLDTPPIGATA